MKYNLVRNAQLSYSSFDGEKHRVFTTDEVGYICDNELSFDNSIPVSGTEFVTFEATFPRRIKIDDIRLYVSSTMVSGTVLDNIYFYSNSSDDDNYSLMADKYIGDNNYYYATMPDPSAPMKIKITISGVSCSISEFFISNNDYAVGFGEDGNLNKKVITRTDDTDRTEAQPIAVYNKNVNSINNLIDAYLCIDYTGVIGDQYLKISSDIDGDYKGIDDNILIQDNLENSKYTWNMGIFYKTKVTTNNEEVVLDLGTTEATSIVATIPWEKAISTTNADYGHRLFISEEENLCIYMLLPDYYLQLYKLYYDTYTWEYIGKVNPGCTGYEDEYSFTKIDNYIYVLINHDCDFGRYDLNGSENNWEVLETPPRHPSVSSTDRFTICGDNTEYIYFVNFIGDNYDTMEPEDSRFAKYSTISGSVAGWEELSHDYMHHSGTTYLRNRFMYDDVDNCFYLSNGRSYSLNFVQKYDINTGVWDIEWFHISNYMDVAYGMSWYCKNNFLYIINYQHLYKYDIKNLNTSTITKIFDSVSY